MDKINKKHIYTGNVEITGSNVTQWEEKLKYIQHIGGDLYINSNASLKADALKSVGGYLYINSKITEKLERQLWEFNSKKQWRLSEVCSEWILSQTGKIRYYINRVEFQKSLFDSIRHGELSAQQVFAITNMEQRRVAYEKMDKTKMAELTGLKVLGEGTDKHGNAERIISFDVEGFNKPFLFYHCICPSTGREY